MIVTPIFVVVIICICRSTSFQFIRPVKSGLKDDPHGTMALKDTISLFEMIESRNIIKVDLNRPLRQQAVIIRNSKSVKVKLFCSLNIPNSIKKSDVFTLLCYQISLFHEEICLSLDVTQSTNKFLNFKISSRSIRNDTGYEITIDGTGNANVDLSGFYYCKSTTSSAGMVLSNVVEIRDILFWGKNLIVSQPQHIVETYREDLNVLKMPKSFNCLDQLETHMPKDLPNWIKLEFKSIVKWAWCPVSQQRPKMMELEKTYIEDCLYQTISKCDKPTYLCPFQGHMMPGWMEFLSFNGTITLIGGQKFNDFGNRLDGYALMCYYKDRDKPKALRFIANDYDNSQFIKGLKWTDIVNERRNIEIISSTNQTVRVGILKKGFTLTAFYYCPPNFTYEWIRNDRIIYNSIEWRMTKNSLHSLRKVNSQSDGKYYLKVKSGQQVVEFEFNLIVSSAPILVTTSVPILFSSVYVMAGSNISVAYQYKARPKDVFVYINGLIYKPSVTHHKAYMNDLTKSSFYLKDLNFSATTRVLPNNIVEFVYNATGVSFSETLLLSQSHSLIVEARNEYGISRSHLNVNVLRFPIYINLPMPDNCSIQCSSLQHHDFRCEINDQYYTDRDIIIEKFWIINGMRLDSLPYYSTFFTEDSKGLHMYPVTSNNSDYDKALKSLFKNTNIVCRIRLLYPESLGLSEIDLIREKRVIFDSINDPVFMSRATAMVKLDWEPVISNASYTWVVFLVIALLLIIMFVFLLVRLTLRDQGGSYQIEKLEIAKGINRDEEIIENETIRPYVRSGNKKKDAINMNNFGNGVKATTNKSFLPGYKPQQPLDSIDDENEIEDPSKFNEEGSFIGVYASKDKLSNLPLNEK